LNGPKGKKDDEKKNYDRTQNYSSRGNQPYTIRITRTLYWERGAGRKKGLDYRYEKRGTEALLKRKGKRQGGSACRSIIGRKKLGGVHADAVPRGGKQGIHAR